MDHETAIQLRAAEQYVAGELSTRDRDEFEEHFFLCPECAEEVRCEQVFVANARAVLVTTQRSRPASEQAPAQHDVERELVPWWRRWLPEAALRPAFATSLAVNAFLVIFGAHQVFNVLPKLRSELAAASSPSLSASFAVPTTVRGEEDFTASATPGQNVLLSFAIAHPFSQYRYVISRERGEAAYSATQAPPSPQAEELLLSIPTIRLDPGDYRVVLSGIENGSAQEIGHCRLRIVR